METDGRGAVTRQDQVLFGMSIVFERSLSGGVLEWVNGFIESGDVVRTCSLALF